jgi:hypothetical protein
VWLLTKVLAHRFVYRSPGLNQRLAFRRVTTVPYRFRYARPTARTV